MLLDSQISRALVQPTPWELAQWRAAALKEKAAWSDMIDIGSSHRFCDDVLRSVDVEIRRERAWCGPAPTIASAAPVPTELARNEFYVARNLFSWMRADYRSEAAAKVTTWWDKVALVAEGAVAPNARSVDANHSFAQASGAAQVAAVATNAIFANREVGIWTGAQRYESTISLSNWKVHDGNGWEIWTPFAPTNNSVLQATVGTITSTLGIAMYWGNAGKTRFYVGNGAVFISPVEVTRTFTLNTATVMRASYKEGNTPEFVFAEKATTIASGASSAAPSASNPGGTMTIGGLPGSGFEANMLLSDAMFANKVDAVLETIVARYGLLRYLIS